MEEARQDEKFEIVAKTFSGLEDVLADELTALGAENVEPGLRMVSFCGDKAMLYRANLCLRSALRVLKPIYKFSAADTDELYDIVRGWQWEQVLSPDKTFSIDTTVYSDVFTNSRYVTYRVKDAIADYFSERFGRRPSIRLSAADVRINVHIAGTRVTVSLDSSGEPLNRRGYRVATVEAPLNEVLAAGLILKTGWRGDSDFVDPMCGSGTLLIEAALIAANINPGIFRDHFAFETWDDFDRDLFEEIYNDDSRERPFAHKIYGGDILPAAVAAARANVRNARLGSMIEVEHRALDSWTEPPLEGVMVTNPPYGERLRPDDIHGLYHTLGRMLKFHFTGYHAWVLGYDEDNFREIGLKPSLKYPVLNGNLECSFNEYVIFEGKYDAFRAEGGSVRHTDEPKKRTTPHRMSDREWENETDRYGFNKKKRTGHTEHTEHSERREHRKKSIERKGSFKKPDRPRGFEPRRPAIPPRYGEDEIPRSVRMRPRRKKHENED